MRRVPLIAVVAVWMAVLTPSVAQGQEGDAVVGSGIFSEVALELPFEVDAHSGPSGENPTGHLTLGAFDSTIGCLRVEGDTAVLGVNFIGLPTQPPPFPGAAIRFDDGGAGGPDRAFINLGGVFGPGDCPAPQSVTDNPVTVTSGNVVVLDAAALPSAKAQCKNSGWKTFGFFKNQGDCVSFVATGGKNQPNGPTPASPTGILGGRCRRRRSTWFARRLGCVSGRAERSISDSPCGSPGPPDWRGGGFSPATKFPLAAGIASENGCAGIRSLQPPGPGGGADQLSPDLELLPPRRMIESGIVESSYHGHDGYRSFFSVWLGVWGAYQGVPEELLDLGDHLLTLGYLEALGESSGVGVTQEYASLMTVKDGQVIRQQEYFDRAEALEAVGLSE